MAGGDEFGRGGLWAVREVSEGGNLRPDFTLRRSGASAPANIAEGYGRDSKGAYLQQLRVAQGSLKEFETHLLLAERVGLVDTTALAPSLAKAETVGKMLRSLIRSIENSE